MYFQNRTVLLTGAARGIGRATVIELVARGARVIAVDIHQGEVSDLAQALNVNGAMVRAMSCDIGSDSSVQSLCASLLQEGVLPDMLINNAFARQWARGDIHSQDLTSFQHSFNINVLGFVRLHQALLPAMLKRGSGHVVDTASSLSIVPNEDSQRMLPYVTSKAAIMGLAYGMRHGLQHTGVRYSVFCPGLTDTRPAHEAAIANPSFKAAPAAFAANVLLDGMTRGDFLISSEPEFSSKIVQLAQHQLDPLVFA